MNLASTIITMVLMFAAGYMLGRAVKANKATKAIMKQTAEMKQQTEVLNGLIERAVEYETRMKRRWSNGA